MTQPAAILATFSDLKLVKGRKCAQLIFEVPIELASAAVNTLGMPNPAKEIWCGIAVTRLRGSPNGNAGIEGRSVTHTPTDAGLPLKTDLAGGSANGGPSVSRASEPPAKPKLKWAEMKPSAQAGILCAEEDFAQFAADQYPLALTQCGGDVTAFVRVWCDVSSRGHFDHDNKYYSRDGLRLWEKLVASYRSWQREQASIS